MGAFLLFFWSKIGSFLSKLDKLGKDGGGRL